MTLGECPRWSADGTTLWWVDVPEGMLVRHHVPTGSTQIDKAGTEIAALALATDGRPWFVADGMLRMLDSDGKIADRWTPVPIDHTRCRANDAAFDSRGVLWITTMDRAGQAPIGAVLTYAPNRGFRIIADQLTIGNGPAFDAAQHVAYVADSPQRIIYRIEADAPHHRIPLIQFRQSDGYPDGMAVDAAGHLWIAHYGAGQLSVWSRTGHRLQTIPTPCDCPTAVALYHSTAAIHVAVTSVRQPGEPSAIWLLRYGISTPFSVAHANTPPR